MSTMQLDEQAIFEVARKIDSAEARAAYLQQVCGAPALARRVGVLLQAHALGDSFLEVPPPELAGDLTSDLPHEQPGKQIGPYKLRELLGEGGMGVVYLAEQEQPVRRRVALKIIKPGMDSRQVIARFEAERQALALMDHPNIARVLDGGTTSVGRPYFVMDLVRGVPITQYCDEHHLTTRQRLELFTQVCRAIQHAHQKGVIHRDIKPTNVLVTLHDDRPVPKVIDFGIAKAISPLPLGEGQGEGRLPGASVYTAFTQMLGTPLYMSPEQAEMNGLDVDTRSDVYSLGVLLYELLTGTTPFDKDRLKSAGFDEMRRIIREEEPETVSQRLARTRSSHHRGTHEVGRRNVPRGLLSRSERATVSELDWIVARCLEKDRTRRYESASSLAADILRYLNDEPVQACPPSAAYRLRKFVRRNKRALATATLLSVTLLAAVGAVAGTVGWAARDRAARQAKVAEDIELAMKEAQTLGERAQTLVDDNPYQWTATLAAARSASRQAQVLAERDRAALDPALLKRLSTLQSRLDADEQDRQLVAQFDTIRLEASQVDLVRSEFKNGERSFQLKALFRTRGIEFGSTSPEQVVAWIHDRPEAIQKHVVAAFDVWLAEAAARSTDETRWLTQVLEAADSDSWRTRARRALLSRDAKAVEVLVRDLQPAQQKPTFLLIVAERLPRESASIRLSLLQQIQSTYPGDFWANQDYASALSRTNPPQWDRAIRLYFAAVALRPQNPGVYLNLGRALRATGDLDGALATFRKVLELAPNYAMAYNNLADVLIAQGDRVGGLAACRKAIELDPQLSFAYRILGRALGEQGDWKGAVAAWRQAVELDPKTANSHSSLGFSLFRNGELDEALQEFSQAIALDPKHSEARHNRGIVLRDQGDRNAAIAEFRLAIAADPKYAQAHSALGDALREKGDAAGALAECRQAVLLDPKLAQAHYGLGNTLKDLGDLDGAVAAYRQAIGLDPKFVFAHHNLGNLLRAKGDLDGAIVAYRTAISLDSRFTASHNGLGNALKDRGDLDGAIAAYRQAIELDPKYAFAHSNLGNALQANGHLDGAILAYREAIRLDANYALAHNNLAWLLATCRDANLRHPDHAVELAKKATQLDPSNARYLTTLGVALYRAGNWQVAIAVLEQSLELRKGGSAIERFFLAMAHWQLDQKDEARRWNDRAAEWMKKNKPEDEELQRFRAEATDLLGIKVTPEP